MIDLDLVITWDEVEEILEDLEDQELLRVGEAEVILKEIIRGNSDGTTKLGGLMEMLLNQCGINLSAVYGEEGAVDVDNLGKGPTIYLAQPLYSPLVKRRRYSRRSPRASR